MTRELARVPLRPGPGHHDRSHGGHPVGARRAHRRERGARRTARRRRAHRRAPATCAATAACRCISRCRRRTRSIASVAFVEVDAAAVKPGDYAARFGSDTLPFDYVWFTPKVDDGDPCEKLKKSTDDGNDRQVIAAKRIYDPPSDSEGMRVLIMRLWPRGIRKTRVDVWLKELGPVLPLLRALSRRRGRLGRVHARAISRGSRGRRPRSRSRRCAPPRRTARSPCSAAAPTRPTVTGRCSAPIC